jgi:hypothetical protein
MRLDPVFVLAPTKKPPAMPTRRAFLLAGGMFFVGAGVGGACGYAAGVSPGAAGAGGGAPADGGEDELKSSGDANLDDLRKLAVQAPIEKLIELRQMFLVSAGLDYPHDPILLKGMERLGNALLKDSSFPDRRLTARTIAQAIEAAPQELRSKYVRLAESLREVR